MTTAMAKVITNPTRPQMEEVELPSVSAEYLKARRRRAAKVINKKKPDRQG